MAVHSLGPHAADGWIRTGVRLAATQRGIEMEKCTVIMPAMVRVRIDRWPDMSSSSSLSSLSLSVVR